MDSTMLSQFTYVFCVNCDSHVGVINRASKFVEMSKELDTLVENHLYAGYHIFDHASGHSLLTRSSLCRLWIN
jgi:hypothetical protein